MGGKQAWTVVSIGSIWLAVILTSIFAPDLVSGSEQDHIPIAAMGNWFWGTLSTGFVLLVIVLRRGAGREQENVWVPLASVIASIWVAVTFASIFAPDLVTGSDPTRIPIVAMMSPVAATVATGLVCVFTVLLARPIDAG
jgi:hypothetical protein